MSRRMCLEVCNPAAQNLNDLRAALQDDFNAMPQQTISQLVSSMGCVVKLYLMLKNKGQVIETVTNLMWYTHQCF